MKRILIYLSACLILLSCGQTRAKKDAVPAGDTDKHVTDTKSVADVQVNNEKEEDSSINAIIRYMKGLGASYSPGEHCIPYCLVVASDESNPDDIRVWGDFRVENYNQSGDTLKSVSGGSHPGCMHVKKTDSGFEVTQFDAVGDGSSYTPTAKAIFGDRYEALIALGADEDTKKATRTKSILDYAEANGLQVSCYQDYGWPAVKIR
ncbi:MAG: hypothetical protein IJM41_08170 [Bacteroidales bacterium]|nr:hypothetical protein [Bacteroidales bacterium]